jgi:DNA-binding winged helix-turn-helix (wHTH) protein
MEIVMDAQSTRSAQDLYRFSEFTLDVSDRRLTRSTCPVHLAPKTYDVLVVLTSRAGRLVTKRELLERIWPGVFVGEGILTVHVAALRKALGDTRRAPVYIETVSRSGYRFIARVTHASRAYSPPTQPAVWRDRGVQP